MDGGEITFKFKGDSTSLDKETNGLSSKMGSVGASIGSAFAKGAAVAGAAMVGLVGQSVVMAGQLEQQIGGTEAVFQEFASTVQTNATTAFSSMGLSANDYMATMNKMGALMQGSGMDIETSMNTSAEVMQRAADVASVMGIDTSSAMEAVAGAAKGNYTMMDNLGVAMNATTLEAYALEQGITKSYNEMSKAEQVGLAYEMFLDRTSNMAGNYAKENETFAGSLSTLKAAFGNFMSGAGDVDQVVSSLENFGKIALESIVKMAPRIVQGIVTLANSLITQLPTIIATLLPVIMDGLISLANALITALPMIIETLLAALPTLLVALINGIVTLVNSLTTIIPTLIPMIIQAILGLIPVLLQNLPLIIQAGLQLALGIVQGIMDSIPLLIESLPAIITSLIDFLVQSLPHIIMQGPKMILALVDGLIKAIPTLIKALPQIIMAIVNGLIEGIPQMLSIGLDLVKGLWQGIKDSASWVLDKIKGFGDMILGGIKDFFGIASPSRKFMYVGEMNAQGLIAGMEDEEKNIQSTFDSMFALDPNLYGSSALNANNSINNTVVINQKTDPLGQMVNDVKTFAGGAKNDYNYGAGV